MSCIITHPKDLILSTASLLAYKEGLSAINIRSIAKQCDIGVGTIYNYFPTKKDLTAAVTKNFWNECFKEFHHAYDPCLDFFTQLESLYFYMLNYLEQFRETFLKDLSTLPDLHEELEQDQELAYMEHFIHIFEELIETNSMTFDQDLYNTLGKQRLIHFIFSNFMIMLKNNEPNYQYFDLILKRILFC